MARTKGMLNLSGNLEVNAGAPLDARTVVPTLADLTVASNFQYKYVGMPVVVQATGDMYILTANDVTVAANWKQVGSGGGGSSQYSTSEQRVGTWIDGKPLYQKTFTGVFGTITDGEESRLDMNLSANTDKVISIKGVILTTNNNIQSINDYYGSETHYYIRATANITNNRVSAFANRGNMSNGTVYITLQYTKTTD